MRLTDITIKSLKPPSTGQATYTDDSLAGFGVRVSHGGAKTFVLVHGKKRKRITIGRYPIISLSDARDKAKKILAAKTLHGDQAPTFFKEALETFLSVHCAQKNKRSTAKETERLLRRHFLPHFEGRHLHTITTPDLSGVIDKLLPTPSECNHAFTAARTFFRFAAKRRLIDRSPLDGLDLPTKAQSRERSLTLKELRSVLIEVRKLGQYGVIVELLILTGQRLSQIALLDAAYVNFEERSITWPKELMKAKEPHTIPYGDRAAQLFDVLPKNGLFFINHKGKAFNNWSNAKHDLDKLAPLSHWTLHDLRRTFSTCLAQFGVAPHVVERLIAHTTGEISGVAAIYNRYSYLKEMRDAIHLWENRLAMLLSDAR